MHIDIDSLKTQFTKLAANVTGKSITPSIVPSPVPVSTNDVVKELYLRDLKKANIIIIGLPITPLLNDDIAVKNLLRDELNFLTQISLSALDLENPLPVVLNYYKSLLIQKQPLGMLSDRLSLFVILRLKASVTWCISTPISLKINASLNSSFTQNLSVAGHLVKSI